MRLLTSIFIIFFILSSCRKDSISCSQKKLIGYYYCSESNTEIRIRYDIWNEKLQIALPDWNPYSFYMDVDIIQDYCSFELNFYDNYAPSNQGPHYWMSGSGYGRLEADILLLEYQMTITTNNGSNINVQDSIFSCSYVKI